MNIVYYTYKGVLPEYLYFGRFSILEKLIQEVLLGKTC